MPRLPQLEGEFSLRVTANWNDPAWGLVSDFLALGILVACIGPFRVGVTWPVVREGVL
jgi:hypothetical protein